MAHKSVPSPDQARQCTKLLKFTRNAVKLVEGCNLCVSNPLYLEHSTVLVALMGLLNPKQGKNILVLASKVLTDFLVPDGAISRQHLQEFYDEGDKKGATWSGFDKFYWLLSEETNEDVLFHVLCLMDHLCSGYARVRRENLGLAERLNNELNALDGLVPKLLEHMYNGEIRHKYHILNLIMSRSNCLNWSPDADTGKELDDGVAAIDASGFRSAMAQSNVSEALVNMIHTLALHDDPTAQHVEHVKFVTSTMIYSLSADESVRGKLFQPDHAEDLNVGFMHELQQVETSLSSLPFSSTETAAFDGPGNEEAAEGDVDDEEAELETDQVVGTSHKCFTVSTKSLERMLAICLHFILHNADQLDTKTALESDLGKYCKSITQSMLRVVALPRASCVENVRRMAARAIEVLSTRVKLLHNKMIHEFHVIPVLVTQLTKETVPLVCDTIERSLHALIEREGKGVVALFQKPASFDTDAASSTDGQNSGNRAGQNGTTNPSQENSEVSSRNTLFSLFQVQDVSASLVTNSKIHIGIRLMSAVLDEDPHSAAELGREFVPILLEILQQWATTSEFNRKSTPAVERMLIGTLVCLDAFLQAENSLLSDMLSSGSKDTSTIPVILEFAYQLIQSGCVTETDYLSSAGKQETDVRISSPALADVGVFDVVKDISPSAVPEIEFIPNATEMRLISTFLTSSTPSNPTGRTGGRRTTRPRFSEVQIPNATDLLEQYPDRPWVEHGALSMNIRAVTLQALSTIVELAQSRTARETHEEAAAKTCSAILSHDGLRIAALCLSVARFTIHPDVLCECIRFLKVIPRFPGGREVLLRYLLETRNYNLPSANDSDFATEDELKSATTNDTDAITSLLAFPSTRGTGKDFCLDLNNKLLAALDEILEVLLRPLCHNYAGQRYHETANSALQALRVLCATSSTLEGEEALNAKCLSQVVMLSLIRLGGVSALLACDRNGEGNLKSDAIQFVMMLLNLRESSSSSTGGIRHLSSITPGKRMTVTNSELTKRKATATKGNPKDKCPPMMEEDTEESEEIVPQTPATQVSDEQWASLLDITIDLPIHNGMEACTALITSILFGHEFITRMLLQAGVNINAGDGQGMTPLMAALVRGMDSVVKTILDHPDIKLDLLQSGKSWCALKYAVLSPTQNPDGNAGLVAALLDRGADPNISDGDGNHPLHWTCTGLEAHVLLDGTDTTLTTEAADLVKCAQHLLNHGALLDIVNRKGETPLHLSILYNKLENAKLFLKHGANPNVLDSAGNLALHFVFTGQCEGAEWLAQELLENGDGRAAESLAFVERGCGLDKAAKTKKLINHNLDLTLQDLICPKVLNEVPLSREELSNLKNDAGLAPIHIACLGCIKLSPEQQDVFQMHTTEFPLEASGLSAAPTTVVNSLANLEQRKQLLTLLLRGCENTMISFSSPNLRNPDKLTPLMVLALGSRGGCFGGSSAQSSQAFKALSDLLIEAGAKVDAIDSKGLSALHYAILNSSAFAWHLITKHNAHALPYGSSISTIHLAVRKVHNEYGARIMKYILNQNNMGQVDELLREGSQRMIQIHPVPKTTLARRKSVSRALNRRRSVEGPSHTYVPQVSQDALLDQSTLNVRSSIMALATLGHDIRYAGTPLMVAAELGNSHALSILLESDPENLDTNLTRASDGKTALHLACGNGHLDCVSLLAHHVQTDRHVRDLNGETPLFDAIRQNQVEVVYYAVELSGALHDQLLLENNNSESALQAAERRNKEVTDELVALRVAAANTTGRIKTHQRNRTASLGRHGSCVASSEDKQGKALMEQLRKNSLIVKCLLKNCHSRDIVEEGNESTNTSEAAYTSVVHVDECFSRGQLYSALHGITFEQDTHIQQSTTPKVDTATFSIDEKLSVTGDNNEGVAENLAEPIHIATAIA